MEQDLQTCKICDLIKVKIADGKFNSTTKRFVDENGALWNGRICAECNRIRVKNKMREMRQQRKDEKQCGT